MADIPPPPPPSPPVSAQPASGSFHNTPWSDLKAQGTKAFKENDFSTAAHLWNEAVQGAIHAGASLEDDIAPLHSNRSVALLRLAVASGLGTHSFDRAREAADQCITAKPKWAKGYFRRGEVYFAQQDFPNAALDYAKACELEPSDEHARRRLDEAQQGHSGFYFQQLLSGKDICFKPKTVVEQQVFSFASQMANFVYIIADARTREAVVVDAAWDVPGILQILKAKNFSLVGAIVTHYHFDHTGGTPPPPFDSMGVSVSGIKDLADNGVKVYVHKDDADAVQSKNHVSRAHMHVVHHQEVIKIGSLKIKCLHTPGHTPGSMCLYLDGSSEGGTADGRGMLISGDTLFIGSCGRLDLPDCNHDLMFHSLQRTLAELPDSTAVYPGHNYGGAKTSIGAEKRAGLLKKISEYQWRTMHRAQL